MFDARSKSSPVNNKNQINSSAQSQQDLYKYMPQINSEVDWNPITYSNECITHVCLVIYIYSFLCKCDMCHMSASQSSIQSFHLFVLVSYDFYYSADYANFSWTPRQNSCVVQPVGTTEQGNADTFNYFVSINACFIYL